MNDALPPELRILYEVAREDAYRQDQRTAWRECRGMAFIGVVSVAWATWCPALVGRYAMAVAVAINVVMLTHGCAFLRARMRAQQTQFMKDLERMLTGEDV